MSSRPFSITFYSRYGYFLEKVHPLFSTPADLLDFQNDGLIRLLKIAVTPPQDIFSDNHAMLYEEIFAQLRRLSFQQPIR
jgi:hypothetical protein